MNDQIAVIGIVGTPDSIFGALKAAAAQLVGAGSNANLAMLPNAAQIVDDLGLAINASANAQARGNSAMGAFGQALGPGYGYQNAENALNTLGDAFNVTNSQVPFRALLEDYESFKWELRDEIARLKHRMSATEHNVNAIIEWINRSATKPMAWALASILGIGTTIALMAVWNWPHNNSNKIVVQLIAGLAVFLGLLGLWALARNKQLNIVQQQNQPTQYIPDGTVHGALSGAHNEAFPQYRQIDHQSGSNNYYR